MAGAELIKERLLAATRGPVDRMVSDLLKEVEGHPSTDECTEGECMVCSIRDCPHKEPLHYHHDGCPACFTFDRWKAKALAHAKKLGLPEDIWDADDPYGLQELAAEHCFKNLDPAQFIEKQFEEDLASRENDRLMAAEAEQGELDDEELSTDLGLEDDPLGRPFMAKAECEKCGCDIVLFERRQSGRKQPHSRLYWSSNSKDAPATWHDVWVLCGDCVKSHVHKDYLMFRGDGPISNYTGRAALPQYLRFVHGPYPFTPQAQTKLQQILLALLRLPTALSKVDGIILYSKRKGQKHEFTHR